MPLHHVYSGSTLTDKVQLLSDQGISAHALLGQVDIVRALVEDADGSADYLPFKTWAIIEDTLPIGQQTIWHGFVGIQVLRRSQDQAMLTGSARLWELQLQEDNTVLTRRLFTAAGANRPAETCAVRMAWLLATTEYATLIADHGLVDAPATAMDATDYRNRTALDVLADMATTTGYNFWCRWRDTSSDIEIAFFDANTSALDVSALRISNVLADVDQSITWAPGIEARQTSDPQRIATGTVVAYTGGSYAGTNATTATTWGVHLDQLSPSANVKTLAAATALANRFLAQHNEQDDSASVRLTLPQSHLNDAKQGQLINAKFSHFRTKYQSFRPWRVTARSISRAGPTAPDWYDVALDLSPAAGVMQSVFGWTSIQMNLIFPQPVTAGNVLIACVANRNHGTSSPESVLQSFTLTNPSGLIRPFTTFGAPTYAQISLSDVAGPDACAIGYRIATGDEQNLYSSAPLSTTSAVGIYELAATSVAGYELLGASAQGPSTGKSLGAFTSPGTFQASVYIWDDGTIDQAVGAGWTQDYQDAEPGGGHPGWLMMHATTGPTVQISGGSHEWGGLAVAIP